MLVRFSDEIIINRDTNSPFLGDPMGIMNHDNNTDDANNGSTPFSQAPMFTADQLQVMHQQFQQRSNNPNVTDTQFMQQQQQQQYSASTNDTTNHNWMQLVQPTPLGSHLQNQQYANQQQSSSREVQLMLQQLFQDQQNQDNNMTGHSSASTSLFTIGSTVEPMHHRSHADSNQDEPDFFKDMWDVDDIALPGKPPSSYKASKATTKRKWMVSRMFGSFVEVLHLNSHHVSLAEWGRNELHKPPRSATKSVRAPSEPAELWKSSIAPRSIYPK